MYFNKSGSGNTNTLLQKLDDKDEIRIIVDYIERNYNLINVKSKVEEIVDKRLSGTPLQYILNEAWFYKSKFYVDERVLIPRPETEWMVEEAVNEILKIKGQKSKIIIADIGTGSGCVAISVELELYPLLRGDLSSAEEGCVSPKDVIIYATDASAEALEVAKLNADRLIKTKFPAENLVLKFLQGSLLSPLPEQVNVIVTNLPYIPSARISHLQTEVKDWEPKVALDGGKDGFDLYRQLFRQLKSRWKSPGLFLGEIDYTHEFLAINEFEKYVPEAEVEVVMDMVNKQLFLRGEI